MIFEKNSADHLRRLVDRCTANRARTALNTFKQLRSKSISQWHRLEPSKFRENRENHSRMIFEKNSADHLRRLVDRCTANRARTALNTFKPLRSKSISQWHRLEASKLRENRENHSRMIFEKISADHLRRLVDRCTA